jgi:hypothetical protein
MFYRLGVLFFVATASAWTNPQIKPKLGELLGSWELLDSTMQIEKGRLDVTPDVWREDVCKIRFTTIRPVMLSTSLSRFVEGELHDDQLCWKRQKHSEIVFLGIGVNIDGLCIPPKPEGNCRKIKHTFMNLNTLRVIYEDDVFIFSRTQTASTSILIPVELWIIMQLLGTAYARAIHNKF